MGSEKPAWYRESILKSKNQYNIRSRTTTKGSKLKECGQKTSADSPPVEGSHTPVMACKQAERQKASVSSVKSPKGEPKATSSESVKRTYVTEAETGVKWCPLRQLPAYHTYY